MSKCTNRLLTYRKRTFSFGNAISFNYYLYSGLIWGRKKRRWWADNRFCSFDFVCTHDIDVIVRAPQDSKQRKLQFYLRNLSNGWDTAMSERTKTKIKIFFYSVKLKRRSFNSYSYIRKRRWACIHFGSPSIVERL